MKRYSKSFAAVLVMAAGCVSAPTAGNIGNGPTARIQLEDVSQFHFGEDTLTALQAKLGKPSRQVHLSSNETFWVYDEGSTRATFEVEPSSGKILTGAIVLRESDPLRKLASALAFFRSANFTSKDEGLIAEHEVSDESDYFDPSAGLSLRVNKANQTVSVIGFGITSVSRSRLANTR